MFCCSQGILAGDNRPSGVTVTVMVMGSKAPQILFANLCPVQVHDLSWQLGAMAAAGATSARPASARGWRPTRSVRRAAPRSRGRGAGPGGAGALDG